MCGMSGESPDREDIVTITFTARLGDAGTTARVEYPRSAWDAMTRRQRFTEAVDALTDIKYDWHESD